MCNEGKSVGKNVVDSLKGIIPELNTAWLLTGEGEMLKDTKPRFESNLTPVEEGTYMWVEYADLRASAGHIGGGDVEQLAETHKRLVPKEFEKGNFLVIRVDGDSMDDGTKRSLSDGDEVLVCERKDFKIDELPIRKSLFVITTREGNVIKQISEVNMEEQYIVCHSFNPLYKDFNIEFREICQIFIVSKKNTKPNIIIKIKLKLMIEFISYLFIAFGILQIILFFKVWGMTNDIAAIKKGMGAGENNNISFARTAYLNGQIEIARRYLNREFIKIKDLLLNASGKTIYHKDGFVLDRVVYKERLVELKEIYEEFDLEIPNDLKELLNNQTAKKR